MKLFIQLSPPPKNKKMDFTDSKTKNEAKMKSHTSMDIYQMIIFNPFSVFTYCTLGCSFNNINIWNIITLIISNYYV